MAKIENLHKNILQLINDQYESNLQNQGLINYNC